METAAGTVDWFLSLMNKETNKTYMNPGSEERRYVHKYLLHADSTLPVNSLDIPGVEEEWEEIGNGRQLDFAWSIEKCSRVHVDRKLVLEMLVTMVYPRFVGAEWKYSRNPRYAGCNVDREEMLKELVGLMHGVTEDILYVNCEYHVRENHIHIERFRTFVQFISGKGVRYVLDVDRMEEYRCDENFAITGDEDSESEEDSLWSFYAVPM